MVKYLELTFQIDSEPDPQRAQVRPSLIVEDLIANIAAEFETGEAADYELYREGVHSPLARSETLEMQQIKSGETLVFSEHGDENPLFGNPEMGHEVVFGGL